jgi:hypothetical protein
MSDKPSIMSDSGTADSVAAVESEGRHLKNENFNLKHEIYHLKVLLWAARCPDSF